MLKTKVKKAEFDLLSDDFKKEYKQVGATEDYVLDLEGYEDPAELKRAKDREKAEAKAQKERADKAEADFLELQRTGPRNSNDLKTLEESYKTQAEVKVIAEKAKTKSIKDKLTKVMRDDVALQLAAKISTAPTLLLPHVLNRLRVEIPEDDGDPLTRVLDKAGKPSALTIDDLAEEFRTDANFSSIIIASRASGGGASGNHSGGAAKKPSDYTLADRTALYRSNPQEHDRLFPPKP